MEYTFLNKDSALSWSLSWFPTHRLLGPVERPKVSSKMDCKSGSCLASVEVSGKLEAYNKAS